MSQQFSGCNNIGVVSAVDNKAFNLSKASFIFHNNLLPKTSENNSKYRVTPVKNSLEYQNIQQYFGKFTKTGFNLHLQICLPVFSTTDFTTDSRSLFEKMSCLLHKYRTRKTVFRIMFPKYIKRGGMKEAACLYRRLFFYLVIRGGEG